MKLFKGKKRNKRRSILGFSLVEATVGLGTVTTVVMALYGALGGAINGVKFARENIRATQILLDKMEGIRLYSWDQLHTTGFVPANFTVPFDPQGAANGTGAGTTYYGTITFENGPTDVTYGTDLKKVTVDLAWKTGNVTRQRQFSSYITRNGLQAYIY